MSDCSIFVLIGGVLPPHLSPFIEEKEGDYVPPERFGPRQSEEDAEEPTTSSAAPINLVENNAYLNGGAKRKRTENEETPKPTSKEERVRKRNSISNCIEILVVLETSNACCIRSSSKC